MPMSMPLAARRRRRRRPSRRYRRSRFRTSSGTSGFGRSGTVRLYRMPAFLPDKIKIDMIYVGGRTLNAGEQWQFSGNNIYDPNISGLGNWTLYYDFWKQVYDRYYVTRSRFHATISVDNVTSACGTIGIHPTDNPLIDYTAVSDPINRFRSLPLVQYHNISAGADQVYTLDASITTRKYFQFDTPIDQLTADVDSGPTSEITWDLVQLQSTAGVLETRVELRLIYSVIFYGRSLDPIAQAVPP